MLNYEKFNNMWGLFENKEALIAEYVMSEINTRRERLASKEKAIDDLMYEQKLMLNDLVQVVSQDLAQCQYNMFRYLNTGTMFWEAWRYANCHKDKDFEAYKDKEVKKKEKQSYEIVCSYIERLLLKEDKGFERVDCVTDYNYSLYYEFTYKIRGQEIYVCIPNFKAADTKTYTELLSGYIIRYRESEYGIGLICSDIDYNKIYDKLMKWINEHWPKEEK